MTEVIRAIGGALTLATVGALHDKTRNTIRSLHATARRMSDIDKASAASLADAIAALQELDNAVSVMSAAASHKREMYEVMFGSLDEMGDIGTLLTNFRLHARARLDDLDWLGDEERDKVIDTIFSVEGKRDNERFTKDYEKDEQI